MMHCTMDDLLALKAGEASGWARKHVETCAACRAELEALYQRVAQLKALPALRAPRDRWPAVRDAVLSERGRRRRGWGGGGPGGAAGPPRGALVVPPGGGAPAGGGPGPHRPPAPPGPPAPARGGRVGAGGVRG